MEPVNSLKPNVLSIIETTNAQVGKPEQPECVKLSSEE